MVRFISNFAILFYFSSFDLMIKIFYVIFSYLPIKFKFMTCIHEQSRQGDRIGIILRFIVILVDKKLQIFFLLKKIIRIPLQKRKKKKSISLQLTYLRLYICCPYFLFPWCPSILYLKLNNPITWIGVKY